MYSWSRITLYEIYWFFPKFLSATFKPHQGRITTVFYDVHVLFSSLIYRLYCTPCSQNTLCASCALFALCAMNELQVCMVLPAIVCDAWTVTVQHNDMQCCIRSSHTGNCIHTTACPKEYIKFLFTIHCYYTTYMFMFEVLHKHLPNCPVQVKVRFGQAFWKTKK